MNLKKGQMGLSHKLSMTYVKFILMKPVFYAKTLYWCYSSFLIKGKSIAPIHNYFMSYNIPYQYII